MIYSGQSRTVKMSWNPRTDLIHHELGRGLGWNFFINFNTSWFLTRIIQV